MVEYQSVTKNKYEHLQQKSHNLLVHWSVELHIGAFLDCQFYNKWANNEIEFTSLMK